MGVEKEGKKVGVEVVDLLCFDDWIDENSIGHDPLIYIEGVVLSQVFYEFGRVGIEFGLFLIRTTKIKSSGRVRSSNVRAKPKLLYETQKFW
jgi:hypothetical protein